MSGHTALATYGQGMDLSYDTLIHEKNADKMRMFPSCVMYDQRERHLN